MHTAKGKQTRIRTSAREEPHRPRSAGSAELTAFAADPLSPKGGRDKAAECSSVIGHRDASHDQLSDCDHFIQTARQHYNLFSLHIDIFCFLVELGGSCLISISSGHEQVVPCAFAMSTSRAPAAMQVSPGKGLGFLSKYNVLDTAECEQLMV